jgi:hypothetical protein
LNYYLIKGVLDLVGEKALAVYTVELTNLIKSKIERNPFLLDGWKKRCLREEPK